MNDRIPVIINGSVRSGTTWLYELLANYKMFHPIYEPDNYFLESQKNNLRYNFLSKDIINEEEAFFYKNLLNNKLYKLTKIYNTGSSKINLLFKLNDCLKYFYFQNKTPLIKFTRQHLSLPYLAQNFQSKIIVIFRHPCAVTESVIRTEMINHSLDEVLDKRQMPFLLTYPKYHSKLKKALELIDFRDLFDPLSNNQEDFSKIRKGKLFMIRWVLNNGFLIDQIKNGEINPLIIFYENLLLQPELELKRITDYLSLKKFKSNLLEKDSNSSQSINIHDHKETHLSKWQNNLSSELIYYIFRLLDIFDIDIYDQNIKPAKKLY